MEEDDEISIDCTRGLRLTWLAGKAMLEEEWSAQENDDDGLTWALEGDNTILPNRHVLQ